MPADGFYVVMWAGLPAVCEFISVPADGTIGRASSAGFYESVSSMRAGAAYDSVMAERLYVSVGAYTGCILPSDLTGG
jgi:hypothetical protein